VSVTESHPYIGLPRRQMWKSAVGDIDPLAISEIASPKRKLQPDDVIGSGGSCFAQHIARHLRAAGYTFFDAEPPPEKLNANRHHQFGFGLYSARYGNIYTIAQLRQLIERAFGLRTPVEAPWQNGTRFHDPFRPHIEPNGYASADEVAQDTASHLKQVRRLFDEINVFVFTLGLTEGWRSTADDCAFPIAPGVRNIGTFDPERYRFVNAGFVENYTDLEWTLNHLKKVNPRLHFVLTVSPVALTATASGDHVLSATTYSKSVLRAVAGELCRARSDVDYFPSYEIVTAPAMGGRFFADNRREVAPEGVEHVMRTFFREFAGAPPARQAVPESGTSRDDIVCEEEILEAYAERQ
jgi:hypothetical protein